MKTILNLIVAAALLPLSVSAAETNTDSRIYMSVYNMNGWSSPSSADIGLYSFSKTEYDPRLEKLDCNIDASGGGVMTEDYYFCTSELNFGFGPEINHYFFKPGSWEQMSQLFGLEGAVATDLAYDHTSGKIYGCFAPDSDRGESQENYIFGTLNETNGERFPIAKIDTPWIALGCTRAGDLYAVDMVGDLYKVEKTGIFTSLGNLGFTAGNRSSGTFDTATGLFYVVVTNSEKDNWGETITESVLYSVDIETVTATRLYEMEGGEAVGGMYIPGPLAADDAPAAVSDFQISFPDGSLQGVVSFQLPSQTFAGDALQGDIEYIVRANGALLGTGKGEAGSAVSLSCGVDEAGLYTVVCEVRNIAGKGERTSAQLWIGHDLPLEICNINLSYDDGGFVIKWTQPEGSQHDGYIDSSLLTYNVVRMLDNVVVAEGIRGTEFFDPMPIPESLVSYAYKVEQLYNENLVTSVSSELYRLGSVALPYTLDFEDEESFANLTVIDVNGDRAEWYREEYWYIEATDEECAAALYPYSSDNDADDWLILPPVRMIAGNKYKLSFQVSTMSPDYTERLAVAFGLSPVANEMVNAVAATKDYEIFEPATEEYIISPTDDGIYYIGFHALSPANGGAIALRGIAIEEVPRSAVSIFGGKGINSAKYYNLQGMPLMHKPTSGIYIELSKDGVRKHS